MTMSSISVSSVTQNSELSTPEIFSHDCVLRSLDYIRNVKEGEKIDVDENGNVLRPSYPATFKSSRWRELTGNHATYIPNLQKLYDRAFKDVSEVYNEQTRDETIQRIIDSTTGLNALKRYYIQLNQPAKTEIAGQIEKINNAVNKELGIRLLNLIDQNINQVVNTLDEQKIKKVVSWGLNFLKDNPTPELQKKITVLLNTFDKESAIYRTGFMQLKCVVSINVSHFKWRDKNISVENLYKLQPNLLAPISSYDILKNKIALYLIKHNDLSSEKEKVLRDLFSQLSDASNFFNEVKKHKDSCKDTLDTLLMEGFAKKYADETLKKLESLKNKNVAHPAVMLPMGVQSMDRGYHTMGTVVLMPSTNKEVDGTTTKDNNSDQYTLFLHDSGVACNPNVSAESMKSGWSGWLFPSSVVEKSTVEIGPFSKDEMTDLLIKSFDLLAHYHIHSYEEAIHHYKKILPKEKLLNSDYIPARKLTIESENRMGNVIEWFIFNLQKNNMADLANDFLAFDPYHTGDIYPYEEVKALTGDRFAV